MDPRLLFSLGFLYVASLRSDLSDSLSLAILPLDGAFYFEGIRSAHRPLWGNLIHTYYKTT